MKKQKDFVNVIVNENSTVLYVSLFYMPPLLK